MSNKEVNIAYEYDTYFENRSCKRKSGPKMPPPPPPPPFPKLQKVLEAQTKNTESLKDVTG